MADTAVAITAGVGTNIDTRTEASNGDHRQVIVIGDPSTNAAVAPVSATNGLSVTLTTAIPAGSASIGILGANSGVDIGDVTINNASGASAVNIQDGGNSITVDNGGTFPTQDSQVTADNTAFTDGTTKVWPSGYVFDETAGTDLTENDVAAARIDGKRAIVYVFEDSVVRGRRATITYQGRQVFEKAADGVTVSGGVLLAQLRQPINVNSNGQILVSGQANRQIRVINGVLMAITAVTVNLKSDHNSDLSGPLALGATGGFQIPHADIGNFETLVGQNLTISMSSAVQVGGWLTYVLV